jgi:transcriptional regulator with XRE-family HTH domain
METVKAIFTPEPLKSARKSSGLTGRKLADQIGVKQSTISNIESCACRPSIETLAAICKVLNVSMDTLFFFDHNSDNADNSLDKYQ